MRGIILCGVCLLTACPADPLANTPCTSATPVLGQGTRVPIVWSTAASDFGAVSEPIVVVVPQDVVGLSLTVDGGAQSTGFSSIAIGDKVVIDASDDTRFGGPYVPNPARVSRETRRERRASNNLLGSGLGSHSAFDTAWDTAAAPSSAGWNTAPLFHAPNVAGTIGLPMSPDTRPWGGCLVAEAVWVGDAPPGAATFIGSARTAPSTARTLDINLVRLKGAGITEAQLDQAVARMRAVFDGSDAVTIGKIVHHERNVADPYVRSSGAALGELRAQAVPSSAEPSLTFLFIADFTGEAGTLGIAAGIPGPAAHGTNGSAVTLSVEAHFDGEGKVLTNLLGETMAHEAGHQFGLFHTTEAEGTAFDILDDTPNCTANAFDADGSGDVDAQECDGQDGRNLMFWTAGDLPQDQLSPQQADVLVRNALVRESP